MLPILLDGFEARGCLSQEQHIRLMVDDDGNPLAHQGVVIHTKDTDAGLIAHLSTFFLTFYSLRSCFSRIQFDNHESENQSQGKDFRLYRKPILPCLARGASTPVCRASR